MYTIDIFSRIPPGDSSATTHYDERVDPATQTWQSKAVLLAVLPFTAVSIVLQTRLLWTTARETVLWALGLSVLLGLAAWASRSATAAAALTGALINASLMFSMFALPYQPWRTGMVPVLVLLILTTLATRFGRRRKERLGTAEKRQGRGASQVAANLGIAALAMDPFVQSWLEEMGLWNPRGIAPGPALAFGLAALAEAAADTVSSEIGQVLGGRPIMLTTFRRVDPGTDGAISLAGTFAGILAAGVVAGAGTLALQASLGTFTLTWGAGVFGLFFDSLLGATLERAGWLNNDAVNFVSTASAAGFAVFLLAQMG